MAVTSIMTTEAEIDQKLGADVDTNFTEAMKDAAVLQAESMVNVFSGVNFSDIFVAPGVNVDVAGFISNIVSSFVAVQGISYNLLSYPSLLQAQTMLDWNFNIYTSGLSKLEKDNDSVKFIEEA